MTRIYLRRDEWWPVPEHEARTFAEAHEGCVAVSRKVTKTAWTPA